MEVDTMNNDKNLVLGIILDNGDGVYRAQRWLKGKVILSVVGASAHVRGEIHVELLGKEITWSPGAHCMGGCSPRGSSEKSRQVFQEEEMLHTFPKGTELAKGVYSYHFSFFLPHSIAPSIELDDMGDGGGCSISYRVRASLGPDLFMDRPVNIMGASISGKKHPYILPPTCISPKRPDGAPVSNESCLVVAAKVEDTHVARGEKLGLALACRDLSQQDIKEIDVELVEEVACKDGNTYSKTLASVKDIRLEGLVKKHDDSERVLLWKRENDGIVEVNNMLRSEMHADVTAKRNHLEIIVPANARDSYEGSSKSLITVKHSLNIILATREKSPPKVSIPIRIMSPPLPGHRRQMSAEKASEVATTVWPKDAVPLAEEESVHSTSCPPAIPEVPHAE